MTLNLPALHSLSHLIPSHNTNLLFSELFCNFLSTLCLHKFFYTSTLSTPTQSLTLPTVTFKNQFWHYLSWKFIQFPYRPPYTHTHSRLNSPSLYLQSLLKISPLRSLSYPSGMVGLLSCLLPSKLRALWERGLFLNHLQISNSWHNISTKANMQKWWLMNEWMNFSGSLNFHLIALRF